MTCKIKKKSGVALLKFLWILGLSLIGGFGCSEEDSAVELLGHYEDATPDEMEKYQNNQTVIAEHEPSMGVVLSLPMFTEHKLVDLGVLLVTSGIEKLYVIVPFDYKAEQFDRDLQPLFSKSPMSVHMVEMVRSAAPGYLREWSRDFAPLTARTIKGKKVFLDFNYYSTRPADDSVPKALSKVAKLDKVSVPIYNEGGNFMNNSQGTCFMTDRVILANGRREREEDHIFDEDEIKRFYEKYAGCKRVEILKSMPFEGTKHIDLWAKFLDDNTVMVGEIRDELLALASYRKESLKKTLAVKSYLDDRAVQIAQLGFKVERLPMPLPWFGEDFDLFRSYTNSLNINKNAIIPKYIKPFIAEDGLDGMYIDAEFLPGYEQEVEELHKRYHYKVAFIPSDSLIAKGGAIHCTTMQVAR